MKTQGLFNTIKGNTGKWLAAVAGMLMLQACLKPETYPIEPVIEFKSFTQIGDSARVIFSFTDGDGDIGLGEDEIQPPFDTASKFYDNVFIRYFEKVNGEWKQPLNPSGELIEYNYRTKKIEPNGKNKALKGDIVIYLLPPFYNYFSPDSDTIMFDIQMADRSLHLSNVVESGEIYPQ